MSGNYTPQKEEKNQEAICKAKIKLQGGTLKAFNTFGSKLKLTKFYIQYYIWLNLDIT